jgi:hypothetical protein
MHKDILKQDIIHTNETVLQVIETCKLECRIWGLASNKYADFIKACRGELKETNSLCMQCMKFLNDLYNIEYKFLKKLQFKPFMMLEIKTLEKY